MDIIRLEEVDSTNTFAKNNIDNFADMTIVISRRQKAGRGRFLRKWIDLGDENLFCSIILKPSDNFYPIYSNLTQYLSAVLCTVLEKYDVVPKIKWPNDVLVSDKKIAGILCETVMRGNNFKGLVLGVGVNLNSNIENLSLIDKSATALNLEIGRDVNISDFLDELLEEFFKNYETFLEKGFAYIREYYLEKANFIGNEITVVTKHEKFTCLACDVNDSGELVVLKNGVKKFISAGDIL